MCRLWLRSHCDAIEAVAGADRPFALERSASQRNTTWWWLHQRVNVRALRVAEEGSDCYGYPRPVFLKTFSFHCHLFILDTLVPAKPDKANTRWCFLRILFKDIDTHHGPQFCMMDVLGGLHQSMEILGGLLVRYSRRSPRLWINKRFFALRRSPLKSPFQPSMMWEITEPTWLSVFAPFVLFSPLSLPWFCLPLVPQNPPTLRTTVLDVWNYDQQHAENCLSNVQVSDTSLVGCCPFSRKVSRPAIAKLATIREVRPNPRVLANLLVLEEKCFAFVST